MSGYVQTLRPVERVLYRTITLTWVFYLFGALYVVGPVLGWSVAGFTVLALYLGPTFREDLRADPPSLTVLIWFVFMFGMLVVLWVGHFDYALGTGKTIKSTIGWAKGWALFTLFLFIGASMRIRPEVLIRGQCVLGMQTLLILPLLVVAPMVGLPEKLFVSPLKAVGGPGPEYFSVFLYTVDPSSGASRWQFFTPWSPFAALVGLIMTLCALEEKQPMWRTCGIVAGLLIVLMSKSRMGIIGLVVCGFGPRLLPLVLKSWAWFALSAFSTAMVAAGTWLLTTLADGYQAFRELRADSTRVRDALQSIARERWRTEAPWFGHGSVEPGAHVTEHMLIGTHHTWFGLLFVKGAVGLLMFALPMVWTVCYLIRMTVLTPEGRLPLGLLLAMLLFSFGENLEVLVYMLWPGLVIIGHATAVRVSLPGTRRVHNSALLTH